MDIVHAAAMPERAPRTMFGRASERACFGVLALVFAATAALTIASAASMPSMGEMPMPGGWTMSMVWMPMCGQTWLRVAASFLGMWVVMMVAMMLPSLTPMLRHYRQAVGTVSEIHLGWLTALACAGYFAIWSAFGVAAFALGASLAQAEMMLPTLARAVPAGAGVAVVLAGALQFTAWKARHLARCRAAPEHAHTLPATIRSAWQHGLRLGLHCCCSCAGLTTILLILGVMDLRAMTAVTAAITAERLAPAGERVAHAIGAVAIGAGLLLIARAVALE